MAEVIAIGASVIAIIQITDRISSLCKHYIKAVRDGPSQLKLILVEISTLKTIFEDLEFLSSCDTGVAGPAQGSSRLDQPVAECLRLVKELAALFPPEKVETSNQSSKKRKLKAAFAELAWPLKESKARTLLEGLRPLKETIILEITSQSRQDIKEIRKQVSKTNDIVTDIQRREIFKWLQHTNPSSLYQKAQQDYEPGTGNWVFRTSQWSDWISLKTRCLWIHGIPGAGKTVLMYPLIEEIGKHCQTPEKDSCICLYYFCFYGHNQNESKPFLKWLIDQLCRRTDKIPSNLLSLHKYGGEPSLKDLLQALKDLLFHTKTVYVVIDALDESRPRIELLQVIQRLVTDKHFQNIQLLASSREYIDIERIMREISTPLSMDNDFVGADIRTYVHSLVHSSEKFKRFPVDLLDQIEDGVSKGARGMFRWAVCQLDILRRLKCEREIIQRALKSLPETLHETYDRIILDLSKNETYVVYCLFRWIQAYPELYDHGIPNRILAKIAEKSSSEQDGSRSGYFYDEDTLKELCGCLIRVSSTTVYKSSRHHLSQDRSKHETLTVDFAHYTVREWFDDSRVMKILATNLATGEKFRMWQPLKVVFEEAHQVQFNTTGMRRIASPNPADVLDAIYDDFNISCTLSALLALHRNVGEIARQDALHILAWGLFDPSDASFVALGTVADQVEQSLHWLSDSDIALDRHFWKVVWKEASSSIAMQFFHLTCFTRCQVHAIPFIEKVLEENNKEIIARSRLRFQKEIFTNDNDRFYQNFSFDGSCIELWAQCDFPWTPGFQRFLEISKGLFDPSKVLRLVIARCNHFADGHDFQSLYVTKQLLQYGASPNVQSHRVTALQIAVACGDLEAVEILLHSDADPNEAGNDTEKPWEDQSVMSPFNPLHGASPLYICRNLEELVEWTHGLATGDEMRKIESILVKYGATSFSRQESVVAIED